ncbi:Transposable element Tcb2 transposase, partial [Camponotus floridanus]
NVETRAVIVALHKEGYSTRQISSKIKVSQITVVRTLRRKQETGLNTSRHRSGRPRVTSKNEDKFICVQSKRLRTRTAPEIREELNATREKPVSVPTVQRRLRDYGLKGCIAARKPLLRKQNKVKRLQWAKKHKNWSINQWKKVLFTDESKFEIFGGKRR